MSEPKPVRLDPYQRIVNVGWGGVDILVLEFSYQHNGPRPASTLRNLPFTSTTYDLFDSVIINSDGAGNATPGNPITPAMLKFLRLWNRTPYFANSEGRGKAMLFFNLRKIRPGLPKGASAFTFKITTPGTGGSRTLPGASSYWVWYDFGDPFPGIEPYLFQGNISFDSVWGTAEEAGARAAILSVHSAYHVEVTIGPDITVPDVVSWELQATTYRKKQDFPTDAENEPQWDVGDAIDGTGDGAAGNSENSPLPSYSVTIQCDLNTLALTSNRV